MSGRIVLARDSALRPVPGTWVTLHRVGGDRAGPLDSARTDARGAYAFRYRPSGVADAIYFVAGMYGGIAYFTRPLRAAVVDGEDAEIAVFDTTSAALPIQVRGRHVIVSRADSGGTRSVLEVFELSNDSSLTAVVPAGGGRGTWSVALPPGARDVEIRAGEVAADAVETTGGRVTLLAPFAPGLRQFAFQYRVRDDASPVILTLERPTAVLEVLIEDPQGDATGGRLVAVAPVTLEGRTFRRFLAQDVGAGATVAVDVSAARGGSQTRQGLLARAVLATVGALMLGALVYAERRRRASRAAVAAPDMTLNRVRAHPAHVGDTERLAREIAALDAAYEQAGSDASAGPGERPDAEREAYERRRARLKEELAAALNSEATSR